MVHCIEVQYIYVPAVQCKSLQALLQLAASQLSANGSDLKVYFVDSSMRTTLMESDTDLLSLKYISKEKTYKFRVEICKSKEQVENELRSEAIEEYLSSTYDSIAEAEVESELKRISSQYLQDLYQQISRKEEEAMIAKIEKEEVARCLAKMTSHTVNSHILSRIPIPERRMTSRKIRVSPERCTRRQSLVEKMVGRVLEEMMPQMVKQLSSRIMEELRSNKMAGQFDLGQNPEEL